MATYSKKQILQFRKTDHFIERSFYRAVNDEILEYILRFYQDYENSKVIAIFTQDFLQKKNLQVVENGNLIVVIKFNYLLITTFWCKDLKKYLTKSKLKNNLIVKFPENQIITKYTKI